MSPAFLNVEASDALLKLRTPTARSGRILWKRRGAVAITSSRSEARISLDIRLRLDAKLRGGGFAM